MAIETLLPTESELDWVAFDCETEKMSYDISPDKSEGFRRGLRGEFGLALAVTWDTRSGEYEFWDWECANDLADFLESFPVVAAYNGAPFDLPLLEGVVKRPLNIRAFVDPYAMICNSHREQYGKLFRGSKIGNICESTLGITKADNDELAPRLWDARKIAKLVRYCKRDVYLLVRLVRFIRDHGWIMGPNGQLDLELPDWIKRLR